MPESVAFEVKNQWSRSIHFHITCSKNIHDVIRIGLHGFGDDSSRSMDKPTM